MNDFSCDMSSRFSAIKESAHVAAVPFRIAKTTVILYIHSQPFLLNFVSGPKMEGSLGIKWSHIFFCINSKTKIQLKGSGPNFVVVDEITLNFVFWYILSL